MPATGVRAVVFDLWDTLADWPDERSREVQAWLAERLGMSPEQMYELWSDTRPARDTGPLVDWVAALGADAVVTRDFVERRNTLVREALAPRPGVVETLDELRARGLAVGLVSVCGEEVPTVWADTVFADRIGVAVFSATCGLMKPDARIYRLAYEQLGVAPSECLYVGDGANDELAGARRVGMRPVLIHRPGEEPPFGLADWSGPRITSIPEVLELL